MLKKYLPVAFVDNTLRTTTELPTNNLNLKCNSLTYLMLILKHWLKIRGASISISFFWGWFQIRPEVARVWGGWNRAVCWPRRGIPGRRLNCHQRHFTPGFLVYTPASICCSLQPEKAEERKAEKVTPLEMDSKWKWSVNRCAVAFRGEKRYFHKFRVENLWGLPD